MLKQSMYIAVIFLLLVSCSNEPTQIKFIETKNNISRFEIKNKSNLNIESLSLEIEFIDKNGNEISIDTFTYHLTRNLSLEKIPFLKVGEQTFIVQRSPNNTHKARAKVFNISYSQE